LLIVINQIKILGFTLSCGQFCTNPGLVILLGDNKAEFIKNLETELSKTKASLRSLTNGIRNSFDSGVKTFMNVNGVNVISKVQDEGQLLGPIALNVSSEVFMKNINILSQEVFGPVTLIVNCETLEDVKEVLSNLEGQLTGTIHATENDLKGSNCESIIDILSNKVGRIIFNGVRFFF
jgi:2,5-dioxopentanoate dehydrogenase